MKKYDVIKKLWREFLLLVTLLIVIGILEVHAEEQPLVLVTPPEITFHYERDYQAFACMYSSGVTEFVLSDNTRVDCLTPTEAIEYDFSKKFYECYTQALYYGAMTNRQPVCSIIINSDNPEQEKEKILGKFMILNDTYQLTVKLQFIMDVN